MRVFFLSKINFMKVIYSFCLAALSATTLFAQIPNSGFENWTTIGSYSSPDSWSTLNNTTSSYSVFTATKASPGSPGASYLKLTSRTMSNTVVNGIAVAGKLDTLSLKAISGYSFNQRPAAFTGKWQHMIYGSSQGSIMVLLTKWNATAMKRDTIAHATQGLSGMAMSWANFSFALNYMDSLQFPDSSIIVMKASGSNPTNNDYLWVDNLAFSGTVAVASPPPPPDLTGITENTNNSAQMMVFPNPSNGKFTVSMASDVKKIQSIQVFDAKGARIFVSSDSPTSSSNNSIVLSLTNVQAGVYTVLITTESGIQSRRISIE
jgi:hypothetical protein